MILLGLFGFLFLGTIVFIYFFVGKAPSAGRIAWGVNFSQKHAQNFGLGWKETYLALLDELGAVHLKVAAHWDLLEPSQGEFRFEDLDWQVQEAERRGAKILLAIGMKTPRWPECHLPSWAKHIPKENQQKAILAMLEQVVVRYKESPALFAWQIENEPFFPFGECPWVDTKFLKKEIRLVQSLDGAHPTVISDSGEGSFWVRAAMHGDIVGTTLYRKVWFRQLARYVDYPFPPVFYWRKAKIIRALFGKEVIGVELQAEPWGPKLLYDISLEEQRKTMNLEQFKENIAYARQTGLRKFYLWGAEWWYWLKEKHNRPEIWNEARELLLIKPLQ